METINEKRYLYIVSTISLKELNEEDLRKDFELDKVKYPRWKDKTFEEYYEFKKNWGFNKYKISQEDNSYFLDLIKAKTCVQQNFTDINDGGIYNYAVIKKVPFEKAYSATYIEEFYIFKYNKETSMYKELAIDTDDETKYISSIICMFT